MGSIDVVDLLLKVITSWQVIAVTLAILIYIAIVNNAAKSYKSPRTAKAVKEPKKKETQAAPQGDLKEVIADGDTNEDLGIEES